VKPPARYNPGDANQPFRRIVAMTPSPDAYRRGAATAAAAVAVAVAVAVAGCGGSKRPSNTTSSTPPVHGGIAETAYRFAACMRDHGSPNFPNPVVSTSNGGQSVAIRFVAPGGKGSGKPPGVPKVCRGILPNPTPQSAQQVAAANAKRRSGLLSFASCLRTHGVSNFPDPTSQGQLTLQMVTSAGVDLHTPATLNAVKDCIASSDGIITPTVVGEALRQTSSTSAGSAGNS
jgi:hypothetical protein